jgi:hypothetical protein|tara:strand:+ start:855 stop:1637 length:783 start_codon:yes stop_codon:yes gene_type:complete
MIKIQRKLKINNYEPVVYNIYTKDEFDKPYIYWKDCNAGDWGISDDGYISECIARNEYETSTEMVFPYGKQFLYETSTLLFEPHYETKNYSSVSSKSYGEMEAKRDRAELAVDTFVNYKLAGTAPDFYKIGKIYRPDQENPEIAARKLFKTKEIKKMVSDKLKDILIEKEIDEGYVLDVMKDAITIATGKEDSSNMIKAADKLSEFLEMKPKTKTQTESLEMDISHQIEANFEKQTKSLKAVKTQEIDDEKNSNISQIEE